jgi:hypothetical protein
VGSSNTKVKKELMIEAMKHELDTKPNHLFIETYDQKLVPLWEAIAYQSQLRLEHTPKELAEAILRTLKEDTQQYELVMLVDAFVRNITGRLAKTTDMTGDILSGYILQTIDILHRLGLDFSVIFDAFNKLLAVSKEEVPPLGSIQDMTTFVSNYLFKSIPKQSKNDYVLAVDIADTKNTFRLPIERTTPSYLMDYVLQDVTYWQEVRELFSKDTSHCLKKYGLAVLDDFGVATPIIICTVDSLDKLEPNRLPVTVHYPDKKVMLLRLGERLKLARRYTMDWKERLEKAGLSGEYENYVHFLSSLRDISEVLGAANGNNVLACQEKAYEFLKSRLTSHS